MKIVSKTNQVMILDFTDEDEKILRLAENLHSFMCHANHTDQCGYFYYNWDKIGLDKFHSDRLESFIRAKTLIAELGSIERVYEVMAMYKELKFEEMQIFTKMIKEKNTDKEIQDLF